MGEPAAVRAAARPGPASRAAPPVWAAPAAAAAPAAVAAEGAGRHIMMNEEIMNSRKLIATKPFTKIVLVLVGLCCVLPMMSVAQTQPAAKTAAASQKGFDTPQQAADALIKAAGDFNVPELLAILGPTVRMSSPLTIRSRTRTTPRLLRKKPRLKTASRSPSRTRTAPPSLLAKNSGHCRFRW